MPDHVKKDFELYKSSQVYVDSQNKQAEEHYYLQPRNLWNMFNDDQKNRLYKNIAASLSQANQDIIDRVIVHFSRIHPDYADGVLKAIKNLAE
jgi:catalase